MAGVYALRDLNLDLATYAIRVRRSNDDAEKDIGFDKYGKLDTTTLIDFVGSNTGYVSVWYDQSLSERNFTQTDPLRQGIIMKNNTIEKMSNGNIAINFNDRWHYY